MYPTTEQTLAAVSLLLNGGGIGQIQDITEALSTAFAGRENDLRSLIEQLDKFVGYLNDQTDDIIAATESLNNLVGQFAAQKPVVDKALRTIPDALAVLKDQRDNLAEALAQLGNSARWPPTRSTRPRSTGSRAQRSWAGAGVAGQRRSRADPRAEFPAHLPVPQRDARQLDARRLRQPDGDRRPDAEPDRRRILHRHPVGGRSDRVGDAVGPHHRPVAQPMHRGSPYTAATRCSLRTAGTRGPDMRLTRQILIQLAIFAVIATTALAIMVFGVHASCPTLFGFGHYRVTVELPETGGLVSQGQRHLPRHRSRQREECCA